MEVVDSEKHTNLLYTSFLQETKSLNIFIFSYFVSSMLSTKFLFIKQSSLQKQSVNVFRLMLRPIFLE